MYQHEKYNNCLNDSLSIILDKCGVSREYMYVYSWHFIYIKMDPNNLGRNIDTGWKNPWKSLEDYAGLRFQGMDGRQIHSLVEEELIGIINCNIYDAFWTSLYKKVRMQHFCAFESINDQQIKIYEPLLDGGVHVVDLEMLKTVKYRFLLPGKTRQVSQSQDILSDIAPNKLAGGKYYYDSVRSFVDDLYGYWKSPKVTGFDETLIQIGNHLDALMNINRVLSYWNIENSQSLEKTLEQAALSWKDYIKLVLSHDEIKQNEILHRVLSMEQAALREYECFREKNENKRFYPTSSAL